MFYLKDNIIDLVKILRELSEPKKKVIIVVAVIVIGIILSFFWIKSTAESISKIPAISLPSIEIPDLNIDVPPAEKVGELPMESAENMALADWKTYIDTEYGFEIKYPNDWRQKNYPAKTQALLGFCPIADTLCKEANIYVVIHKEPYTVKDEFDYYLGKSELTGFYYYLYTSSANNKEIFDNMISSFKFIK